MFIFTLILESNAFCAQHNTIIHSEVKVALIILSKKRVFTKALRKCPSSYGDSLDLILVLYIGRRTKHVKPSFVLTQNEAITVQVKIIH